MLSLLGLSAEIVDVDFAKAEQKQPAFLAKNPFGTVPVLEDGDVTLGESNAILVYLAKTYAKDDAWLPNDPLRAAETQRWLSVASGPLYFGPAAARVAALFRKPEDMEPRRVAARALFAIMDAHLGRTSFLTGTTPTIADVAMYAYTAHAPEGGVSLAPFANIRAWLARVEALPRFVPMPSTKTRELTEAV